MKHENSLNLYLLKKVIVSFLDGRCFSGILMNVSAESQEILLDDVPYSISEVSDIEMVGHVTYHTYADDPQKACEIDGLYFGVDDFVADTDISKIRYNEFDCLAACHLAFMDSQLSAKKVRILSLSHKVCPSIMSKTPCLYMLRDGSTLVGTLNQSETMSVQTSNGTLIPIDPEEVQDIIRLPQINEYVEITLKNSSVLRGVVSATNESMMVIIDKTVQPVPVTDVLTLRYKGVISIGTAKLSVGAVKQIKIFLGKKEDAFLCKMPYFRSEEDADRAVDGAVAYFVPGVTNRGLIAKDVVVESTETAPVEAEIETGIIVLTPTVNRAVGYIGKEFVTKTYSLIKHTGMPRGNVCFRADQISFNIDFRNVYVVKYQCVPDEPLPMAQNIVLEASYPLSDYAKIWIDESGATRMLPVSVLFLENFLNQKVDVETNDQNRISGILARVDEEEIVLDGNSETMVLRKENIFRIRYSGIVTAYQPNSGTGFINGQYWFHVNNMTDRNEVHRLEVGSPVSFTFEVSSKGNMCAAKDISIIETIEKKGYVLKYVPKNAKKGGFGFLITPDLLAERLKCNDKSGTVYFKESEIENPRAFKIDTNQYYYSVAYTEGENQTAYNVRFLEAYAFRENQKNKPEPAPERAPVKKHTETKLIAELAEPDTVLSGVEFEYGLINIFSSHYALINPQYINRTYTVDGTYDMSQSVYFNPEEATVVPDSRLKTGKYAYLVRYVKKGTIVNPTTEMEQFTIDYSYPVEVVYAFLKKQCANIRIEGDKITVDYVEGVTQPPSGSPKSSEDSDEAPEIMLGESVYFQLKNGSSCHEVYLGEDDTVYLLANGSSIEKTEVAGLFRFGVITALSVERGTATINNCCDFNLSVAEPKMVSILKNQTNLVRLHVMYACKDGKITEVCRVSKSCLSCLKWDAGIVTEFDSKVHTITIDSSITHYLSVMSEGINAYVNNGSILNRPVFVKQVFHPYLGTDSLEPNIVATAVEVRCQEEELRIEYDEGKDVYLGYRNATVSFPILSGVKFIQDIIGQTIPVSFRVGADMSSLEGYIDEEIDETEEQTELADVPGSQKIHQEALVQLLFQKEDAEQLIAGKFYLDSEGKIGDLNQVQRAVDFLTSKSKRLAAAKIALDYPDFDVLGNMDHLIRSELQARCHAVGLDANSYYGEQAYYLSTVLQYPTYNKAKSKSSASKSLRYDYLYRLFLQDFESREHLMKYLQAGYQATQSMLVGLFRQPCLQVGELIAHTVFLDKLNVDTVCSMIRNNPVSADEIIAYAKEIDDTISEQDISAVIYALQERYIHDKRRFTGRMKELLRENQVCENLQKLIINMQSRFLKLICKDDRQIFERLLKICKDVLDFINKPGFTQQEQLLLHTYREIGMLEEDILAHPCKESVEILLCSDGFNQRSNILVSVKNEIYDLLNRLYQDASMPRIHCRVNEISLLPGANKFWLIVENGSRNENLQPAENLSIELESFTLGFMPRAKVRLPQNRLDCGDQLAVEVEFELSAGFDGVMEFGWTARYEFTTEFHSNGSTSGSVRLQESDVPLQLQLDTTMVNSKNYGVDNPYYAPAKGQPLIGKEMFFGREVERQKILDSIRVDNGEKRFIPGSAVIIHGQKKSGKTSLVNQVRNYIKEDVELSPKAIFLNFSNILDEVGSVEQLRCFKREFYALIMSRLEDEICENHPDVAEKMDEIGLEVPDLLSAESNDTWSGLFDKFFRNFARMDGGEHNIILFMDEFTLLCTAILAEVQQFPEKVYLNNIPNFIKTFSQYGFIQIIIGHEAMMRALGTLGVLNHTAEFAKPIEIAALDDAASRALVIRPMLDKFGFDVYGSELGKQAVDRLLDLSGCNPTYLMRLCNKMFMYYTDREKCPRTQLLISDVNAMVQEYTGELLLSDFDILLMEDGDDAVEAEKRITYHYLKCAALLSLSSYDKRTADNSEITRALIRDYDYSIEEIEKTRNILEARRVISITNGGRVKINTGLFSEYIQQKNGL